ncbi:MAG TPA: alpha/beta hydrolase [Hyphomicrobiaceae bacterium]|nr:alpha/beta hydrolase [Hyphomicrobiaceae bacterium]
MARINYEAEYDNRARVPESVDIKLRWNSASMLARQTLRCELDQSYGDGPRQRFDLFLPDNDDENTPHVIYIHGGYWQRGDRKDYSFIATELVARGIAVSIPSYTLCPQASVAQIIEELRGFVQQAWRWLGRRSVVVGHSAGGHLAAALLATDWSRVSDVPADLVPVAYAISGIYDLVPLIHTSNDDALRLSEQTARAASPLFWKPPPGRVLVAAVGGAESQEFLRQSLELVSRWAAAGVKAECVVVPGKNHFTILDELARGESAMVARIVELARRAAYL